MNNNEIRRRALAMADEIQKNIESYNRIDPAFMFVPTITIVETETLIGASKKITVDVSVIYNTKNDPTPAGSSNWADNA